MRAVVQRVSSSAAVDVDGERVAQIGRGFWSSWEWAEATRDADARYLADKVAALRIFADESGKMNLSVEEIGGRGPGRLPVHVVWRLPQRAPPQLYQQRLPPRQRSRYTSSFVKAALATGASRSRKGGSAR